MQFGERGLDLVGPGIVIKSKQAIDRFAMPAKSAREFGARNALPFERVIEIDLQR